MQVLSKESRSLYDEFLKQEKDSIISRKNSTKRKKKKGRTPRLGVKRLKNLSNYRCLHISAYGEVVATLERLQLQLRNISGALGISGPGVEAELEAVRTLLVQSRFASALATHHILRNRLRSNKVLKHHTEDASTLARDVRISSLLKRNIAGRNSSLSRIIYIHFTRFVDNPDITKYNLNIQLVKVIFIYEVTLIIV